VDSRLLVFEVLLLGSNDTSGARNAQPRDALVGGEAKMLHHVDGDQGPRTSEPRKAVDCNRAFSRFGDTKKAVHKVVRRRRAIREEEVIVIKPVAGESSAVVLNVVESHYRADVLGSKDVTVIRGNQRVAPVAKLPPLGNRTFECEKFVLDHLMHVSVPGKIICINI